MKKKIFAGILALAAVLALVCIIFAQGGFRRISARRR